MKHFLKYESTAKNKMDLTTDLRAFFESFRTLSNPFQCNLQG